MTQVSSADGRLILTCDALNVGGYGSGHRVTTYRSPLPNVNDVLTYIGGGDLYFLPGNALVTAAAIAAAIPPGSTGNVMTSTGAAWTSQARPPILFPIPVPHGGTGSSGPAEIGDFFVGQGAGLPMIILQPGVVAGTVLTSNGAGIVPTYQAVPGAGFPITVAQGGTGSGGPAALGDLFIGAGAGLPMTVLNPGANATVLTIAGGVPTWQAGGGGGFTGYPVTVLQGGTGIGGALTNNGVMVGQGASPIVVTAAGVTGQFLAATTGNAPSFQYPTPRLLHSFAGATLAPANGAVLDAYPIHGLQATSVLRVYCRQGNTGTPSRLIVHSLGGTAAFFTTSTESGGGGYVDIMTAANPNLNQFYSFGNDQNSGISNVRGFIGGLFTNPWSLQLRCGSTVNPGFFLEWSWSIVQVS